MPYHVYVIALKSAFAYSSKARKQNPGYRPGKNCYYVGYTSKSPQRRYIQHMTKGTSQKGHNISSKVVFDYGIFPSGLRAEIYNQYNHISTKEQAMKMEKALANKLRMAGHCVWQN